MTINYAVRKKVFKKGDKTETLYFAVPKAIQKKGDGIDEIQLAQQMADRSSLSEGDALSAFQQLSDWVSYHLSMGRTVNIRGLGSFFPAISSEGTETPEEITADKVRITKIGFKADKELIRNVRNAGFVSVEQYERKKKQRK